MSLATERQQTYAELVMKLHNLSQAIGAVAAVVHRLGLLELPPSEDEFKHAKPSFVITYILQLADGKAMSAEAITGHYAQVKGCSQKRSRDLVRTTLYNLKRQKKVAHDKAAGTYTLIQGTTRGGD